MTTETLDTAAAPKTLWQQVDHAMGYIMFALIIGGGVISPFALYAVGMLNN